MLVKRLVHSIAKKLNCSPVTICSLCNNFIYCYECDRFTSCNNCNDNLFYRYCEKKCCNKNSTIFEEEIKDVDVDLYTRLHNKDT
jgi:hypothetical protein